MPQYESPYDPATSPKNLKHIIYEKKGHVAYVTINRPDVKNALHSFAYAELRSCWRDIGLDPNIYVGIVTGAGSAFCAGRDVKFLASYQAKGLRTPHEDPNNPLFHWGGGGQPSDVSLEKPLIAAMNGLAVGVGLSLALQCQLRVMADDAWIGDTHTKVGRLGSAHNLYQALPRTTAAYLTLCNGRLTAQECLQQAIVNKVVPRRQLLAAAAVGYSHQMGEDEEGTVQVLSAHRAVIDGLVAFHGGRIMSTAGDSVLAEFASVVEAVRCAVEIQEALKTSND